MPASNNASVFSINFNNDYDSAGSKSNSFYVRAVRGGQ